MDEGFSGNALRIEEIDGLPDPQSPLEWEKHTRQDKVERRDHTHCISPIDKGGLLSDHQVEIADIALHVLQLRIAVEMDLRVFLNLRWPS